MFDEYLLIAMTAKLSNLPANLLFIKYAPRKQGKLLNKTGLVPALLDSDIEDAV